MTKSRDMSFDRALRGRLEDWQMGVKRTAVKHDAFRHTSGGFN